MYFIFNFLKGLAIGAGAILPGISSGVLCVIFGIYEKLLDSVLNFFTDVKTNFKFLLPIFMGTLIGIFIFSKFLNFLFYAYPIQTNSIFIGLILGSIPSLIKESHKKEKFKAGYLIFTIIAFIIGIITVLLEKNSLVYYNTNPTSYIYLFLSGFIMSMGIIIPGVSSTIILMLLGIYQTYLVSISNMYFPVLIPMILGILLGSFVFMKITKFLLDNCYIQTFYTIFGFTLGSIFVLLPKIESVYNGILSLLCIILGFYTFNLLKLNN